MRSNNDFIFQQKKSNTLAEPTDDEYYGFIDDNDFIDTNNNPRLNTDNDRTLAKKIQREDGTFKYFVKINGSKKLFNPISIYGKSEIGSTFLDKTCKDFKFLSVNKKIFDLYVNFLRTKNVSWLYNAEREAE